MDPREGINEITLPSNQKIWIPDTFFVGVDEKSGNSDSLSRSVIEPNGYVRYRQKLICFFNFNYFFNLRRSLTLPIEIEDSFPFSSKKIINLKLSSGKLLFF